MTNPPLLNPPYFNHPKKRPFFSPREISLHPRPSENCIEDLLRREGIPPEAFSVLLVEFDICFPLKHRVWWFFSICFSPLNIPQKSGDLIFIHIQSPSKVIAKPVEGWWVWLFTTPLIGCDWIILKLTMELSVWIGDENDQRWNCWWKKSSSTIWDV